MWARWAHPRSRGENIVSVVVVAGVEGSSPLTRGKPTASVLSGSALGLIPAHAGKTTVPALVLSISQAHPRSRGENAPAMTPAARPAGSSPLTRGKLSESRAIAVLRGLIPAHAGKTSSAARCERMIAAHPRSRGENDHSDYDARLRKGSSPLTRGKPKHIDALTASVGLIPAHAGKTRWWRS